MGPVQGSRKQRTICRQFLSRAHGNPGRSVGRSALPEVPANSRKHRLAAWGTRGWLPTPMALTSPTVEERSTAFRTQEPMPGSAAGLNATARDVAELLAQEGLVKRAELDGILVEHKRSNARVLTLLLQRHLVGEAELAGFLSRR